MPKPFAPDPNEIFELKKQATWPDARHRFDETSVLAIRAALAARRPLLLRGEPGIGKSQLARAAAHVLEVPFLYHVVDERSERDDLLCSYDAVSRLAQAQVSALLKDENGADWRQALDEQNFIRPGVLWWAFNWPSASRQAVRFGKACRTCPAPPKPKGWKPTADRLCGPVVLVDEIDKADPSVPNGLLESLGNDGFQTPQLTKPVELPAGARPPLVIITTNEERELPAAFLRRCFVLQMRFPSKESAAAAFLRKRARVYAGEDLISNKVCDQLASYLWQDREEAKNQGLAIPGAAEYLDLVRVLTEIHPKEEAAQLQCLDQVKAFALRKNLSEMS